VNLPDSISEPFSDTSLDPSVRGILHRPTSGAGATIVLTHGAGGNAKSALLIALAEKFAAQGFNVLRCDLPFRQKRPYGPPRPGDAALDRDGLKNAVGTVRKLGLGRVFLGGQSYGGRQAAMLCADSPDLVGGLVLLSYPLHAPGKPDQPRIQHLPKLQVPCLFVHGTRDPFGSIEEIQSAVKLIPGRTELLGVEGAGHDLGYKGKAKNVELPDRVAGAFQTLFGLA
jgi:predicted alpha/beta-hydrolase family hydrolase